jgi:hypothetical protein
LKSILAISGVRRRRLTVWFGFVSKEKTVPLLPLGISVGTVIRCSQIGLPIEVKYSRNKKVSVALEKKATVLFCVVLGA